MQSNFLQKKHKIVSHLSTSPESYTDLSPKGSVDEPIRQLIDRINSIEGLVTTSSCSGRLSVFLEGRKKSHGFDDGHAVGFAGPGGKGAGGRWLFVSHEALNLSDHASVDGQFYHHLLGLSTNSRSKRITFPANIRATRFARLKFEPMILHVLTASLCDAGKVLSAALQAGFRESGATSVGSDSAGSATPLVAVRSTGFTCDSIVGYVEENQKGEEEVVSVVNEEYLRMLLQLANDRFETNSKRIERFRLALLHEYVEKGTKDGDWEDVEVRRTRKRVEGLMERSRRKASEDRELEDTDVFADQDDTSVLLNFDIAQD